MADNAQSSLDSLEGMQWRGPKNRLIITIHIISRQAYYNYHCHARLYIARQHTALYIRRDHVEYKHMQDQIFNLLVHANP